MRCVKLYVQLKLQQLLPQVLRTQKSVRKRQFNRRIPHKEIKVDNKHELDIKEAWSRCEWQVTTRTARSNEIEMLYSIRHNEIPQGELSPTDVVIGNAHVYSSAHFKNSCSTFICKDHCNRNITVRFIEYIFTVKFHTATHHIH